MSDTNIRYKELSAEENILEGLLEKADLEDVYKKKQQLAGCAKLTWDEIKSQYPEQLVGLIEVEYTDNSSEDDVKSAIVVYAEKYTDRYKMEFLASKGEIVVRDTRK